MRLVDLIFSTHRIVNGLALSYPWLSFSYWDYTDHAWIDAKLVGINKNILHPHIFFYLFFAR